MKKLLLSLLLILAINQLLSAQVNTDTARHSQLSDRELGLQYLKKANTQRTIGWVMLGAGIAMEIISLTAAYNEDIYSEGAGANIFFPKAFDPVPFESGLQRMR